MLLHLPGTTRREIPVPDEESDETMLKLLETFSESLIGDDAVLVRKSSGRRRSWEDLLREQDFLGL